MKNLLVLLAFISICPHAFTQLSSQEQGTAKLELDLLRSLTFEKNSVDSFLISPEAMAPKLYLEPHWWSFVQEKYNYRETSIPRAIQLLSGDADLLDFQNPSSWNEDDFYPMEHFTLSKSGKVLEHAYQDSTLYFYDNKDQLRQTVSYSGADNSILYLQLYDYDSYGNLTSSAYFFHGEDGFYLDHYNVFSYKLSNTGFFVRHDHHLVIDLETKELETTTHYLVYNDGISLSRSYQLRFNKIIFSSYEYQKIQGTNYLIRTAEYNWESGEPISEEVNYRDSRARVTYSRTSTFGGYAPYAESDSVIYVSDNEEHRYNRSRSGLYQNSLTVSKYDSFGNIVLREIYDLTDENPDKVQIESTYNYDLMTQGTWKAKALQFLYWDEKISRECYIRQFLDGPIGTHNPEFHENEILKKQIEQLIPPEKR